MKTILITPTKEQKDEFIKGMVEKLQLQHNHAVDSLKKRHQSEIDKLDSLLAKEIDKLNEKYSKLKVIVPEMESDRKEWDTKSDSMLINFYQNGVKASQIAKELDRSTGSINQRIQKLKKSRPNDLKRDDDKTFFDDRDSKEEAKERISKISKNLNKVVK